MLFDNEDESADAITASDSKPTPLPPSDPAVPSRIHIPEHSIPANWTGKTPQVFLEELCRKEKAPKPVFQKLASNGCRLHVKLLKNGGSSSIKVEEKGPNDSYKDVQHFVAVKALYQINPTLPLYRLFPPFYRDVWLSWLDEERKEKVDQASSLADERLAIIDELIECIPTATTTTTTVPLSVDDDSGATARADERRRQTSSSCGEEEEETSPQPLFKEPSWHSKISTSKTTATGGTPTDIGRRLKEQFMCRQASSKYKSMLPDRTNLPIYSYREEILETIRKNPVTILCAETGTYFIRPRVRVRLSSLTHSCVLSLSQEAGKQHSVRHTSSNRLLGKAGEMRHRSCALSLVESPQSLLPSALRKSWVIRPLGSLLGIRFGWRRGGVLKRVFSFVPPA